MQRPRLAAGFRPTLIAVTAVLGFMLAIAFNSNLRVLAARPHRASDLRSSDLVGFVREMEEQRRDLRQRLADLRAREAAVERRAAEESGAQRSLTRELEAARAMAGLSEVVRPGHVVELADAKVVPANAPPNDFVIHDYDISAVVNALLAGGAEAVSVNGERIVSTTAIRCAGNTVLVNATRLGSPYRILAVGDVGDMRAAIANDRNVSALVTEYAEQFGLGVTIAEDSRVTVPGYRGAIRPIVAQPLEGGGDS